MASFFIYFFMLPLLMDIIIRRTIFRHKEISLHENGK